jgi:alkylation response protein AidB-like acyl-CoA dehydrogenase
MTATMPTTEQAGLRDAARELFAVRAGREARRAHVDGGAPYDVELWNTMAVELGLHGILIDERYGGAGGTLADLAIALEELGAALVCAPFFATVVMAATAIAESGDEAAQAQLLPAIASGELVATLAFRESPSPDEGLTAQITGDTWTIRGSAVHVIEGASAQVFLVVARTNSGRGLFLVHAQAQGVQCFDSATLDPTRRLATISMRDADATLIGAEGDADATLARTLRLARVALSAEQVGGAQRCLDMSVDYVKNRRQFGRPIGSFQSVKHRCADMYVDVTTARAVMMRAARAAAHPEEFADAVPTTSALVSDAYTRTAAQTIQLHGGIGYTWEHDAHLYLKRAISSARILGTPAEHREHVASTLGLRRETR